MTIGEKSQKLREQRGFILKEIAKESDTSFSYISKIENDKKNLSVKTLQKLAKFYNVNTTYVVLV